MTSGDRRQERLARNEALFREINENIRDAAVVYEGDLHLFEFLCECAETRCTQWIRLTVSEYEQLRQQGGRFAIVPGHDDPAIERVVGDHGRYAVVEKIGSGAEVALDLDPRRPSNRAA